MSGSATGATKGCTAGAALGAGGVEPAPSVGSSGVEVVEPFGHANQTVAPMAKSHVHDQFEAPRRPNAEIQWR